MSGQLLIADSMATEEVGECGLFFTIIPLKDLLRLSFWVHRFLIEGDKRRKSVFPMARVAREVGNPVGEDAVRVTEVAPGTRDTPAVGLVTTSPS